MSTSILNITEVADGQIDQFATFNAALRSIEASVNDWLAVDLTSANGSVTQANLRAYGIIKCSGHTVARDLVLATNKRLVFVVNAGTGTVSVKVGSSTVSVTAGAARVCLLDGTTNGLWGV